MSNDQEAPRRVDLRVHRSVTVLGVDDKPALELVNVNGEVTVSKLPRNASRRSPVRLVDLKSAVEALA